MILIQLADCQTYIKTIHHIHLHHPSVIIVPNTFNAGGTSSSSAAVSSNAKKQPSLLLRCLQEEFEDDVAFETVGRKYFNDSAGMDFVVQLALNDDERAGKFLALGNKLSLSPSISSPSLVEVILADCDYLGEGTMTIDADTAVNLELVGNRLSKKSSHSLFGLLNHCFTPMAARLLRVNILAPITVQSSIDARLDAVEGTTRIRPTYERGAMGTIVRAELINTEGKYRSIKDALTQRMLKKIDLDKLVASTQANYDRLLDVARETYKENVGDILDLCKSLASDHELPFTPTFVESAGGFWPAVRKDEVRGDLPRGCINLRSKGAKWKFTTLELEKRNSRMKDSLDETLLMSDRWTADW
ncbi:MutS protein msh4 [Tulasnella sp. 408]|nr:MutS protein msh4 [Tulasnella sp. 408]